MVRLTPGVDEQRRSTPDVDGSAVRERHGLGDRPVVVCVSRLMPRKGQDTLIARAGPPSGSACPDAALLLVGGGPVPGDARDGSSTSSASRGDVVLTGGVPARRAAGALRRRRRVRDAVPHPPPRARRRGARHRLPRGRRDRAPRRRRRLRRRARRGARRRDRVTSSPARDRDALAGRLVTLLADPDPRPRHGGAWAGVGREGVDVGAPVGDPRRPALRLRSRVGGSVGGVESPVGLARSLGFASRLTARRRLTPPTCATSSAWPQAVVDRVGTSSGRWRRCRPA